MGCQQLRAAMRRQIPGKFRISSSVNGNVNLSDGPSSGGTAYASSFTPGATLVDSVTALSSLGPSISQKWKLLTVTVSGYLLFLSQIPTYGKFGKVMAALVLDQKLSPTQGPFNPYVSPILPLPDTSLAGTLWDPATDPLPPVVGTSLTFLSRFSPSNSLAVFATIPIPISLDLIPGENLAIGLWMFPSLVGSPSASLLTFGQLVLQDCQYTLNYDDGL